MRIDQLLVSKRIFRHSEAAPSLADSSSIELLIRTPAESDSFHAARLTVSARATGSARFFLFEAPVANVDGTARTLRCGSRLDPLSSLVSAFSGPTTSDDGTSLAESLVSASLGLQAPPWLLSAGTDYLVRLTNVSGGSVAAVVGLALDIFPTADYLFNDARLR